MLRVLLIGLSTILLSACVGPGPWGHHGGHPPRMAPDHGYKQDKAPSAERRDGRFMR